MAATLTHTDTEAYRLVVASSTSLSDSALEAAIDEAASHGEAVAVIIPAVLPATLPIWAAPARILDRVTRLRRTARERLDALEIHGTVEVVPCRSVQAAIGSLCDERPPAGIVIAGSAPWRLRRAIRGLAPVTVLPARRRARRTQPLDGRPALEP
jgi:hypothetical protein